MDLVGIEPTTSSMPWKRAPSCATGPRWGHYGCPMQTAFIILAEGTEIVNARHFFHFFPQVFSGIIDRARHLHKSPKTI